MAEKKKVLIVDDEQDILLTIGMIVGGMGYETKLASDGKNALKLLEKENFDLVLLDIIMPDLSGKAVLEKIRANPKLKNTKVAFLTVVQLSEIGKKEVKKLKPIDYFTKPIDIPKFKEKLKQILS